MKVRTESEEKYEKVFAECKDDIVLICKYYVKDDYIANEIMQKTFVKVYERYRFERPEKLKAYLSNAARNMAMNYIRDSRHEVQSDEIEVCAMQSEKVVESPEYTYIQSEERRERIEFGATIFRELQKKNENWYAILYMLCVLEMDHDEVAEKLGVSKDVVYARLHRARTWLRKKYGEELDDILT